MRRAPTLCVVMTLTGFYPTAASSAEFSMARAVLELQAKPVPQKSRIARLKPIPMSENSVKAGRLVWANNCRPCHGLQGKGDGVAPPPGSRPANLVDDKWDHGSSDAEIFKTIKEEIGRASCRERV